MGKGGLAHEELFSTGERTARLFPSRLSKGDRQLDAARRSRTRVRTARLFPSRLSEGDRQLVPRRGEESAPLSALPFRIRLAALAHRTRLLLGTFPLHPRWKK